MRRYFTEQNLNDQNTINVSGDLYHHIFDVCRTQVGQHLELINNIGEAYLCQVSTIGKKSAELVFKEKRQLPALKTPFIHLVISVPRYPVLEAIMEKSVELGVKGIHLAYSDFSQVKSDSNFAMNKVDRWKKIIIGATQQSGRGDLMPLNLPRPLKDILDSINQNSKALGLFAYEGEGGLPLKSYLAQFKSKNPEEIWVFIGGEGGFSDREVDLFKSLDLCPVTLGEQILRVETACVAITSALKYEFDLLK